MIIDKILIEPLSKEEEILWRKNIEKILTGKLDVDELTTQLAIRLARCFATLDKVREKYDFR